MSFRFYAPSREDFDTEEEYQDALAEYEYAEDLYADEYHETH